MPKEKKPAIGGYRPGSGRKSGPHGRKVTLAVRVTVDVQEWLREVGTGRVEMLARECQDFIDWSIVAKCAKQTVDIQDLRRKLDSDN